jgi:hypothetical protein
MPLYYSTYIIMLFIYKFDVGRICAFRVRNYEFEICCSKYERKNEVDIKYEIKKMPVLNRCNMYLSLFFVVLWPNAGHGILILEVSRSHTTHHTR